MAEDFCPTYLTWLFLLPDTIDEAKIYGAAITAGVGLGVFEDFNSVDRFMKINHTVYPQKEAVERYSYLSEIFNHTYDAFNSNLQSD